MQKILDGWDLNNVFNADETSFFWKSVQNHGLSTKGLPGKKLDKTRMSVLVMMNATGTEKIHLLFIATAQKPRCFLKKQGGELGFWYFFNKKAWMTGEVFAQAMEDVNKMMKQQNRKILLLIDNFSRHKWRQESITHIRIECFSPNLTPFVQPADAGIIRCLKAHFRKLLLVRSLNREDAGEDDIFVVNQLEAMRLLNSAWDAVTPTTIQNCWRKTGILPQNTTSVLENTTSVPEMVENTIMEVEIIVDKAAKLLTTLNSTIRSRHGTCQHLATPHLVENIEELLEEPPEPEWPEEDADEMALLDLVRTPLCSCTIVANFVID